MKKFFLCLLYLCHASLTAASALYTNGGGTGFWNNNANWNPASFPNSSSDDATFDGGAVGTVTLGQGITAADLNFAAGAHTTSGTNTLFLLSNSPPSAITLSNQPCTISSNLSFLDTVDIQF